jgi:hypothetical protein
VPASHRIAVCEEAHARLVDNGGEGRLDAGPGLIRRILGRVITHQDYRGGTVTIGDGCRDVERAPRVDRVALLGMNAA